MTAKIYQSELHDAVAGLWDSTVKSGGEGINLVNGLTYNSWKPFAEGATQAFCSFTIPAAITADYFAFDGHNLADIDFNSIALHASTDEAFTTPITLKSEIKANIINGANILNIAPGDQGSYRYYRLWLTHSTTFSIAPIISNLSIGASLALPEGIKPSYTPPRLGVVSEILNNGSQGSHFIGRSIKRKKYEFTIKNENVARSWITTNWLDLLAYIETNSFFYLWNDDYSDEGVFCWTDGKIKPPSYQDTIYFRFAFKCTGFY